MKTLILEQPHSFKLEDTPAPQTPGRDEALVRVRRVGVCGTDIHAFHGKQPFLSYPRILGHELGVEVAAIGETDTPHNLKPGDICAVNPYMNCGQCISCRRGVINACVTLECLGVHCDGGMREYITLPIRKLHRADGLPVEHVALVEMLCIGAHAARRAQLQAGENALVIGAGPIGLATMLFARLMGANVIAMDINPARLAFCRDTLNIEHVIDARQNPLEEVRALLGGELPLVVFDATGSAASMMAAFQYVAHSGRLVYVGLVRDDITFSDPYLHSHELTILASRNATPADFEWVIGSLQTGAVSVERWITHQAAPEAVPGQFEMWTKPETGVIKAMVTF
jgi:threonine dehydrogenase-like Zn-dependent dehydrogenase